MKKKRMLALIMGAIIASSGISQMAVQVYADDEESSSSSYSDQKDLDVVQLKKLERFESKRVDKLVEKNFPTVKLSNLYVSVFELMSNNEAKLVCFDVEREFKGDINVP